MDTLRSVDRLGCIIVVIAPYSKDGHYYEFINIHSSVLHFPLQYSVVLCDWLGACLWSIAIVLKAIAGKLFSFIFFYVGWKCSSYHWVGFLEPYWSSQRSLKTQYLLSACWDWVTYQWPWETLACNCCFGGYELVFIGPNLFVLKLWTMMLSIMLVHTCVTLWNILL